MIYVPFLFQVSRSKTREFVEAFQTGGRWGQIAKSFRAHLHTDILGRTADAPACSTFLTISFFTSMDGVRLAGQSVDVRDFIDWLHQQADVCICLGVFTFLPRADPELSHVQSAPTSALCTERTEVH
jgi:hypothetical protein